MRKGKGWYLWTGLSLICLLSFGQAPPEPYGPVPSAAQLSWHEMEMYCLIHFGVDTYTDKEWGYGDENPAVFNPAHFDAAQIVGAAKAGGFKGVVIVAKHHDGFCLWPTATTAHNITRSPWRNGQGDMIREYKLACDKLSMHLGLYCSPWDRNNPQYGTQQYVSTYRAQVKELYTHYGPLFISWHDGANGGDGYYGGAREQRKIDRTTYYGWDTTWAMIRKLQPSAVIFGDVGPDVRWVGNEEGYAGATCWATYTPRAPDAGRRPSNGYVVSEEGTEGTRNGSYWMPAECDVPLRPGWFYHASQDGKTKSPDVLLDLYYKSVGRGAGLDLGLSPNREGLISGEDVSTLKRFGDLLRATFRHNLAKGARLTASNIRGRDTIKYGPAHLLDDDRYSYWATDDEVHTPMLFVTLARRQEFNVIRLRENIRLGQRIDSFAVDIFEGGRWKEIARATSIGSNRLIRLPQSVSARKLQLQILGSPVCIALSDFALFLEPDHGPFLAGSGGIGLGGGPAEISETGWKVDNLGMEVVVDMGRVESIGGFSYLPRQDKRTEGTVDKYAYFISIDGVHWEKVASGEFANIAANPILQITRLDRVAKARYFKLSALHLISGQGITGAQLGAL